MSTHPANLIVRFVLEISALAAMAYWGWTQHAGWLRFGLAIGLPVLMAILWGIFNVANDTSRSGKAPVPVPGVIRLLLELGLFGLAIWMLYDAEAVLLSFVIGAVVVVHYALSYDPAIPGGRVWYNNEQVFVKDGNGTVVKELNVIRNT